MILSIAVIFLFVGAFAGFLAGLLGIGGGIIFVPIQVFIFDLIGIPVELRMKLAVATSLATIVLTTITSAIAQAKREAVNWSLVFKMALGTLIGAFIGSYIGKILPSKILETVFGGFTIALGIYLLFVKAHPSDESPQKTPNMPIMSSLGLFVGTLASMLGIGGGMISVPIFMKLKLPIREAVGTGSLISLVIAVIGAITWLSPIIDGTKIVEGAIGYIYLPAFLPMAIGSVALAPFGVQVAHYIKRETLKRVFSLVLCLVGILMMLR
jgi:uncharacterized protein